MWEIPRSRAMDLIVARTGEFSVNAGNLFVRHRQLDIICLQMHDVHVNNSPPRDDQTLVDAEFEHRCTALMESLQLCKAKDIVAIDRLAGGVASDIAALRFADRTVCVKFALAQLKVDEPWYAPVHRGRAEYAWLQAAGSAVPGSVPELYGWSASENGFAMDFITGEQVYLWKSALLAGRLDTGEAATVGKTLGRIHAASVAADFDRSPFDNMQDFESLRIDPYLRFSAQQHPELAGQINTLANQLSAASVALIHGDVSPKNILFKDSRAVMLDAECATMGDPAFDVAFALNHLILKSIHLPDSAENLRLAAEQLWLSYAPFISWEQPHQMQARISALLPVLMLARIDGKSPVEYLSSESRQWTRRLACQLIARPVRQIRPLLHTLYKGSDA